MSGYLQHKTVPKELFNLKDLLRKTTSTFNMWTYLTPLKTHVKPFDVSNNATTARISLFPDTARRPLGDLYQKPCSRLRQGDLVYKQTLTSRPSVCPREESECSKCNCERYRPRPLCAQVISHCFIRWVGTGALHNATTDCPAALLPAAAFYSVVT